MIKKYVASAAVAAGALLMANSVMAATSVAWLMVGSPRFWGIYSRSTHDLT